jgi:hypothetical protein
VGFVPGSKVWERKEPGSETADREAAFADESVPGRTGETRVDRAEAISLTNQVTIDEAQAGELISVRWDSSGFHPKNSMRTLGPGSTIRVFKFFGFRVKGAIGFSSKLQRV